MFSTDFIFRQQENLVDNQKCQAGFSPLCIKILLSDLKLNDYVLIRLIVLMCFFILFPDESLSVWNLFSTTWKWS